MNAKSIIKNAVWQIDTLSRQALDYAADARRRSEFDWSKGYCEGKADALHYAAHCLAYQIGISTLVCLGRPLKAQVAA